MNFDINGYDTRGANNMNVYLPRVNKEVYKQSFMYKGGIIWNALPDNVKNSENLEMFKYNYKAWQK